MSESESSTLPKGKGRAGSTSETTPLLSSSTSATRYDGDQDDGQDDPQSESAPLLARTSTASSRASSAKSTKKRSHWPSTIAIIILVLLSIGILLGAFVVPAAVEHYAKQAAVLEPTNLSLESITADGVRARVEAKFRLDGSRVSEDTPRRVGRFVTWVVRRLGIAQTKVAVYLPQYDNALLGTATLPPFTVDIVDGKTTAIDFVAELVPGSADGIRTIANDWLQGKLDWVKLVGKADISLNTGVLPLGTHSVVESLVVEANKLPSLPPYNISRLSFRDVSTPGSDKKAVRADVTITAFNKYPVQLDIPELGFQILVPNCDAYNSHILVADATTNPIAVKPRADVSVDAEGIIREIPESLLRVCPGSRSSPLDLFLRDYLHGDHATVFVRGRKLPGSDTPDWVSDILSSVTVPVPFPGRSFDNLVKDFSLTDVNFKLPSPLEDPDSPDANPKVSGTIQVLASLPRELNLDLNVTRLNATADVLYKKRKFAELNLPRWQNATSERIEDPETKEQFLKIRSRVNDVPLDVTDGDVFSEVVEKLFLGNKEVQLDISANVSARVETVLGQLVLKDVPTVGKIPVKPLPGKSLGDLQPKVGDVKILDTTTTAVHIVALVNITNPTPYTANIPYLNVHAWKNGSLVGEATVEGVDITTGNNTDVFVTAKWYPAEGGEVSRKTGVELISQYLSGYNTTITFRTHAGSIPSVPRIGDSLSRINLTVSAPKLSLPGDDEEEKRRFIRDATFHLFSSTATFTLVSPFHYDTLYLDDVNATAFYNHTEPVGQISYDEPFPAPPGASKTPRLPVDWSVDSIGYDAVKNALGGGLKLDARANVTLRLGNYVETVWYAGHGIGATIRP